MRGWRRFAVVGAWAAVIALGAAVGLAAPRSGSPADDDVDRPTVVAPPSKAAPVPVPETTAPDPEDLEDDEEKEQAPSTGWKALKEAGKAEWKAARDAGDPSWKDIRDAAKAEWKAAKHAGKGDDEGSDD